MSCLCFSINCCASQDHINLTIGRQSYNLKELESAPISFKHLLSDDSKQSAAQQNSFLLILKSECRRLTVT